MYDIVLYLHIIVSLFLVVTILIQRGRGGGLVESLAGAESLFGTKTSSFLVKATTTLAILFFITSTGLAFLSKQRGRSVFEGSQAPIDQQSTQVTFDETQEQAPGQESDTIAQPQLEVPKSQEAGPEPEGIAPQPDENPS
ncbi:MAG: preprotein translocase subunit SecG [Candidatus Omnitrophica bacterium]|nr:preprotein translocase subunit SecG [Candidatus Omnitrophota bacterium]